MSQSKSPLDPWKARQRASKAKFVIRVLMAITPPALGAAIVLNVGGITDWIGQQAADRFMHAVTSVQPTPAPTPSR